MMPVFRLTSALAMTLALGMPLGVHANAQHDRMRQCNAEAKEKALKGDDRKQFMKVCLSAKKAAPPATSAAEPPATPKTN
jgi:hypothetical protein